MEDNEGKEEGENRIRSEKDREGLREYQRIREIKNMNKKETSKQHRWK